jgi:glutamine cyclotransferase
MIESTGLYSQSDLRVVDIATGNVLTIVPVDSQYFAEGCTFDIVNEFTNPVDGTQITTIQIVQLTWKEREGLVYELDLPFDGTNTPTTTQLRYIGTFDIDTTTGEGWGIAYHPVRKQYVVSDGSSNLHFWELQGQSVAINAFGQSETKLTFVRVDTIGVTQRFSTSQGWTPVSNLNELEWDPYPSLLDDGGSLLATNDDDTILANIWKTDYIVRIRLSDGKITHQYDMSSLDRPASASVLNGIAAVKDSSTDPTALYSSVALAQNQYWITGKWWSQMYRIKLLP